MLPPAATCPRLLAAACAGPPPRPASQPASPCPGPTPRNHRCSFQSPVEIPGVSNIDFLRVATNARRKASGEAELDPLEFYAHVMPKVRCLAPLAGWLHWLAAWLAAFIGWLCWSVVRRLLR